MHFDSLWDNGSIEIISGFQGICIDQQSCDTGRHETNQCSCQESPECDLRKIQIMNIFRQSNIIISPR